MYAKRVMTEIRNKWWTFFQPNPQDKCNRKGDCHIRCIAGALGVSWLEAYDLMYEIGRRRFDSMSADNIGDLLIEHGFTACKVSGDKPTVNEFCKAHPHGTYVLRLASHVVCVKEGQFLDTWDCGKKSIYRYWAEQ